MTGPLILTNNVNGKVNFNGQHLHNLENIQHTPAVFRTHAQYTNAFVDNIKETIIRKYDNLLKLDIQLAPFDNGDPLHSSIVDIVSPIKDQLQITYQIDTTQSVIITVYYESKMVFVGILLA